MRNQLWNSNSHLRRTWLVLMLSLCFFLGQLIAAYVTHSLTLLSAAYQMLYNIFSLGGCIATIKMCERAPKSVSNTFGWARMEVMSMAISLLFLAALNFSLIVEAIRTMIHADHEDVMHHPVEICILTGFGLLLNVICIVLIGGYTHHQGSFLVVTPGGEVVIHGTATEEAVRRGLRRLPRNLRTISIEKEPSTLNLNVETREDQRWPAFSSIFRDVASSILVLVTAIVVYINGDNVVSLFLDPALAIVSALVISITSYPFMSQASRILLQTTPAHIDVKEFETRLMEAYPSIVNIHDFHIWALTPSRIIVTAHLLFTNESVYLRDKNSLHSYFAKQGITNVTLQPEFHEFREFSIAETKGCILTCNNDSCKSKGCCLSVEKLQTDQSSEADHGSGCHHSGSCPSTSIAMSPIEDSVPIDLYKPEEEPLPSLNEAKCSESSNQSEENDISHSTADGSPEESKTLLSGEQQH